MPVHGCGANANGRRKSSNRHRSGWMEQARKRSDAIDDLLTRTDEDLAKGILTPERCRKTFAMYEQEQKELTDEICTPDKTVRRQEEAGDHSARFMNLLSKYAGADIAELTPAMVNELVKRTIVHEADDSSGKRVQKIGIIFSFIGGLDFPAISQPIAVEKGLKEKTA